MTVPTDPPSDGLELTPEEAEGLQGDSYDLEGHLSKTKPGDPIHEIIHELRNTRAEIRLTRNTFVSKVDFEERLDAAGKRIRRSRLWTKIAIGTLAVLFIAAVTVGTIAALAYKHQQHTYQKGQYATCLERSKELEQSADFLRKYIRIESESQDQKTARQVIALLNSAQSAPPDCTRLKP